MTSYQLRSSCCVCAGVGLCVRILVRIILVSFMGMLVYRLVMSSLWCGSMGVFSRSFSRSWAFFTLKEWGRGANWFTFFVNSFDNFMPRRCASSLLGGWVGLFCVSLLGLLM